MRAEGRPVTRTELLKQVWNLQYEPGTNVVDVAVQRLRRKIDDGHAPALLQTVRGLGYAISVTP
ncbi:MAG: winged helix-turn-helix domain-containing protein [Candidatus Didemnitutus sp.]|nr:winged helix-turn-helix domain-containing protein [Candidatus Didemnitutus sp.]